MADTRATGTSPAITITAENFDYQRVHQITDVSIDGVSPPEIANGSAYSHSMGLWKQVWSDWNYCKIVEPKFDGIAQNLGIISNMPDFIKDYHFIGLMRNVDIYLAPSYKAHIFVEAHVPTPSKPPTADEV